MRHQWHRPGLRRPRARGAAPGWPAVTEADGITAPVSLREAGGQVAAAATVAALGQVFACAVVRHVGRFVVASGLASPAVRPDPAGLNRHEPVADISDRADQRLVLGAELRAKPPD